MRRLVIEEPVSRAAIWGWRVALFAVPVFAAGVVLTRGGDVGPGLAVVGAASLLALVALLLGLAALAQIWREGRRGLQGAVAALLVAASVLVLPAFLVLRLAVTPYYADLTTDPAVPPAFSRSSAALEARGGLVPQATQPLAAAAALLAAGDGGVDVEGDDPLSSALAGVRNGVREALLAFSRHAGDPARLRDMQRRAAPEFRALQTDLPPEEAFRRAGQAARAQGWRILDSSPPGGRFGLGHLDAVHHTTLLRLPVDVTVRLRIHAEGTTIDVRSIPRYRLFDIGTGPRLLEQFLSEIVPGGSGT